MLFSLMIIMIIITWGKVSGWVHIIYIVNESELLLDILMLTGEMGCRNRAPYFFEKNCISTLDVCIPP